MTLTFARMDGTATTTTVAAVGTTASGSPELSAMATVLTTSAGQVAAKLPANHPVATPRLVVVSSATAATVFPPTGGKINNGSTDAAFSVAQNKPVLFYALSNGLDYLAVLSA